MTPEQRAQLIKRYEDGVNVFIEALDSVPEVARDFAPQGEWSPREIAHHVADFELVRGYKLRQLLAQDAPTLQSFDEGQFLARLHYYRPVEASLTLYRATVRSNVELFTLAFPEDWLRAGNHEEIGVFSLEDLLQRGAEHFYVHAQQMKGLS
jgi:DinB superfamily